MTYDPEVDAMSIVLRRGVVDRTVEVTPYVLVHLDADDMALNIEILGVSQLTETPDQLELLGIALAK